MDTVKLFHVTVDGEKQLPIPPIPGRFQLDRARLAGRLLSTNAGNNYNWKCSQQFLQFLNRAPYQPVFDVLLQDVEIISLGWHQPSDHYDGEYIHPFWVSWGGTGVDSPALIAANWAEDCAFRKDREALFDILYTEPDSKPLHQGHLEIKHISKFREDEDFWNWRLPEEFAHLIRYPKRPVVLFNHAVFADKVIALDNKRLIYITDDSNQGLITSPDHPLEPVKLTDGWWLLEHPIPETNVD
jgi:hypothetical protein